MRRRDCQRTVKRSGQRDGAQPNEQEDPGQDSGFPGMRFSKNPGMVRAATAETAHRRESLPAFAAAQPRAKSQNAGAVGVCRDQRGRSASSRPAPVSASGKAEGEALLGPVGPREAPASSAAIARREVDAAPP